MKNSVKDLFSAHSDIYAKYRPLYPQELFDFILEQVITKDKALDCGTGNGQAAGVLANFFKEVHATDISERQIANAVQKPNIHYHICSAEQTPFGDNTFDLITCATAVHWFNFERFFAEMKRVGKNNAVFACWAYNVLQTENQRVNSAINKFYSDKIYTYWDPERRHVDEAYKNIPLPFSELPTPGFATLLNWDLATLQGYLNTWSAVQHYIRLHGENPIDELITEIRSIAGANATLKVIFPIFMRLGIITK